MASLVREPEAQEGGVRLRDIGVWRGCETSAVPDGKFMTNPKTKTVGVVSVVRGQSSLQPLVRQVTSRI
jgi:hypothetical protein